MTTRLEDEIRQTKPFRSMEEEAFVSIQRTADDLLHRVAQTLKPRRLSPAQYNVLRILRGAGPAGLACREIADRMIHRDPDITRLLDRLEHRGFVVRTRLKSDRRVILTRITAVGERILTELDGPVAAAHARELGHLGKLGLRTLIDLLERVRSTPA